MTMQQPHPPQDPFAGQAGAYPALPPSSLDALPGVAPAYDPGEPGCRFCGSVPAVDATVRKHVGLIFLMRFVKLTGPFCRSCGMASVRDMTSQSMWQGWWGYASSVINPITMLMNIGPMRKFKRLPEPSGGSVAPMNPGKPLFRRPAVAGLLIPVVAVGVIVYAIGHSTEAEAVVGACVVNHGTDSDPNIAVVDCNGGEATWKIVGRLSGTTDDTKCEQFPTYQAAYLEDSGSSSWMICLEPLS